MIHNKMFTGLSYIFLLANHRLETFKILHYNKVSAITSVLNSPYIQNPMDNGCFELMGPELIMVVRTILAPLK